MSYINLKQITGKILLSLIVAITISISSKLIASNEFDLKLNQKPQNVSTYDWCKRKANDFIKESKLVVLNLLGIKSEQEWEQRKIHLKTINKNKQHDESKSYKCKRCRWLEENKENSFPKEFSNTIVEILKDFKNKSVIKEFTEKNGIITAKLNDGQVVKFLNYCCSEEGPTWTDWTNIYTSPKACQQENLCKKVLQGFLGHEIAHIKSKHSSKDGSTDRDLLYLEYDEQYKQYDNQYKKYDKEYKQYEKQCNDKHSEWNKYLKQKLSEKAIEFGKEYLNLNKKFTEFSEKFNKFSNDFNKLASDFDNAMENFIKAQEAQADIVGIFNNPELACAMKNQFDKYANEKFDCDCEDCKCNCDCDCKSDCSCDCEICIDIKSNPESVEQCECGGLPEIDDNGNDHEHPSDETRANYMDQIYESMLKDRKLPPKPVKKELKEKITVSKPQRPANKPNVIVNKPAPANKETIVIKPSRPANKPQKPANKPNVIVNKPSPVKQPVVDKKPAPVNKPQPVIVKKPAPVNTQGNKVSELTKKFEKLAQERNNKNNLQKK